MNAIIFCSCEAGNVEGSASMSLSGPKIDGGFSGLISQIAPIPSILVHR
jgi:hypothetical protein